MIATVAAISESQALRTHGDSGNPGDCGNFGDCDNSGDCGNELDG
jgi:hypothetical protein